MIVCTFKTLQLTDRLNQYDLVDSFLGSTIASNGNCEAEIQRRIDISKSAMSRLAKKWNDRSMSHNIKN